MTTPNKAMALWGDTAMYPAEPIEDGFPKAHLLQMTYAPLLAIAAAAELYEGNVVRNYADITEERANYWFDQMTKTKLGAPLEFVTFHFLLEGVTRGFTHQLVRQRTATFVQESTRFAVKEDVPTALPPSLMSLAPSSPLPAPDDPLRAEWDRVIATIEEGYGRLVNNGMPAEDARGLLPTNLQTRVHYFTNLRSLADHAGNRLCTQAQFEWRLVWAQMMKAIREYGSDSLHWREFKHQRWQRERICELFKPVCFQTGRCAFDSLADRACSIRPRVKNHERHGERPELWADIDDAEWLANPHAARGER